MRQAFYVRPYVLIVTTDKYDLKVALQINFTEEAGEKFLGLFKLDAEEAEAVADALNAAAKDARQWRPPIG